MKKNLKYRMLVVLAVVGVSIYLFVPPSQKINLGLDLKGGIHLVLQVMLRDALLAEAEQVRGRIDRELRDKEVAFAESRTVDKPESPEIEILGVPPEAQDAVEVQLREYSSSWTYQRRYGEGQVDYVLQMIPAVRKYLAQQTVNQARETISNRVDQYGVAEPTITVYGSGDVQDQIIVELPGVDDPNRVINLIRSTARLELRLVHPEKSSEFSSRESAAQAFGGMIPPDYEVLPYRDINETGGQTMYMVVRKAPSVTGRHLKNARRSQDSFTGRSEVSFFLNTEGVALFTRTTEQNVGNRLAIVLDDEIRSAPVIESRIASDSARITGQFTPEQAEDLALILRSGALPARITILENRVVGPSLGMDSIRRGILASLAGAGLVILAMLIVYRLSGANAIICLAINVVILLGVLGYFRATLTLPGIAGVILTIGMAVDANILIFERIKEELRLGKTVRSAVDAGFTRVFTTILDTNLTTLIAALFLFQFGTGPIRGFAVTLAVGLIANVFAATFVSRTIFDWYLQKREVTKLSI
ncbi:MAG TPA: protein translocase subunit SecD [Acidobacteriota bacterium]|nr:protein translocase subunit SecD [Acidobacteriota bacterium]